MKKIEAIIRPSKLQAVQKALGEIGITGMTILDVLGTGQQKGYTEIYRSIEYKIDLISKVKIEIVLSDDLLNECVETLVKTGRTGEIGDGKLFISDISQVIRIRTGEQNSEAM